MPEFTSTITGLNGGTTETELSLRFKELVDSVAATGKRGTLTLKLTVERNKRKANLIEITAEVKSTVPQPPPPSAAFLLTSQGEMIPLEDTQGKLFPTIAPPQVEGQVTDTTAFEEAHDAL